MFGPVTVSVNLENVIVALCAIIALIFAAKQLGFLGAEHRLADERERARQRAGAEDLWRRYELLCIEHPDFAFPKESTFEFETESGRLNGDRLKFTQYEYFASFLLYAVEEIHYAFPNENDWKTAIYQEVEWHKTYLTSSYFQPWAETNNKYIRDLIDQLRERD